MSRYELLKTSFTVNDQLSAMIAHLKLNFVKEGRPYSI